LSITAESVEAGAESAAHIHRSAKAEIVLTVLQPAADGSVYEKRFIRIARSARAVHRRRRCHRQIRLLRLILRYVPKSAHLLPALGSLWRLLLARL